MSAKSIIAYNNGNEVLLDELKVSVTDRAFMFGDAVYEVLRVYHGRVFLLDEHLTRLNKSLHAVGIEVSEDIADLCRRNIAVNHVSEGMVYVQISRGQATRNHSFYDLVLTPNILIYTKPFFAHPSHAEQEAGISAITHDDWRWARCDIKTVNLLANCLIQTFAQKHGAKEAILVRDGMVTEATSSNVFLVKDGVYFTPPLSQFILPGTRRQFLIDRLRACNKNVVERPIEKSEIFLASEIFISSTLKEVIPVIAVDNKSIGTGKIGAATHAALDLIKNAADSLSC